MTAGVTARTQRIREAAIRLGFVRAGVAPVEPLARGAAALDAWLSAGFHGDMAAMAAHTTRANPTELLATARSIVVVALSHPDDGRPGPVARYARGGDYHQILSAKLRALAEACAEIVGRPVASRPCVDTAPLLEREAAAVAGIGFVAKSTMIIVPGVGSYVMLGELLLDVDLEPGSPIPECCSECTACIEACPTGAIVDAHLLDARRCISYLTIEARGPMPRELRPRVGERLFGCDVCQEVCPFNASPKPRSVDPAMRARQELTAPSAKAWLLQGSGAYRRLVAGTALRRASRNQLARNAAVALGNSRDPDAAAALAEALARHASPLVRGHSAWALGRLATDEAAQALERLRATEEDPQVVEEIRAALDVGEEASLSSRTGDSL